MLSIRNGSDFVVHLLLAGKSDPDIEGEIVQFHSGKTQNASSVRIRLTSSMAEQFEVASVKTEWRNPIPQTTVIEPAVD